MDKSKDGLYQICRFKLQVRISLSFPLGPRLGSDQLRHRESLVNRLSPCSGPALLLL